MSEQKSQNSAWYATAYRLARTIRELGVEEKKSDSRTVARKKAAIRAALADYDLMKKYHSDN